MIDHDESTYIVISDALLEGATYQVDYIDTKPIGIFLIFSALQSLFGPSIVLLRLATALVVAATAFLLHCATLRAGSTREAGLAAGIIYIILTSSFAFWGIAPNTEVFFNLFTAMAVCLCLGSTRTPYCILAGLSLGLGILIKQVVVFDAIALGLFLVLRSHARDQGWRTGLGSSLALAAGMVIPFLATLGLYHRMGHLEDYWFLSYQVPTRYPSAREALFYLHFSADFFLRFLPVTLLFLVALTSRSVSRITREFGLLWSVAALVAVLLPGRYFEHYFVQFMLPFSFVAGSFFAIRTDRLPAWTRWTRKPSVGLGLLGLVVVISIGLQARDYTRQPDYPRQVANYLAPRLREGDRLYAQKHVIAYHLLDRLPPNRYVHPSLLLERRHVEAMEIDVAEEMDRIESARPRFLILDPSVTGPELLENDRSRLPGGSPVARRSRHLRESRG